MKGNLQYKGVIRNLRIAGIWLSFLTAIICLTAIILYIGLEHTPQSLLLTTKVIKICQVTFIAIVLFNIIFTFKHTRSTNRSLKWILEVLLLFTGVCLFSSGQTTHWYHYIVKIVASHWFIFTILGLYSIMEISFGIARFIGRKTNPSLILAGSFIFFIILGSLLLMLPKCTHSYISYTDSLFVATSAVSITGLSTVDVAATFTPLGIGILALLIQIGALGVLTFTSFFALFFSGETSIYNQLMVRDMVYSKSANALLPTLLYVFLFTLSIEIIGAVAIFISLPSDFPLTDTSHRLIFSGFQSLSAFCNAGFTWLQGGMGNTTLMESNQWIYIIMGTLVILGGIGFPILVNLKTILFTYCKRFFSRIGLIRQSEHRFKHLYDINTRIVLITSAIITIITIILFLVFEWDNSLAGMNFWKKIAQAYFNSSIPRSSGFASVNPVSFLPATLLLMMFLMWIGGASQSTAGGIKVNTFAAMLLNLKSIVTNKKYITVFGRTLSVMSIRRANAVIGLSILSYFLLTFILVILEPDLSVKDLAFESASALFTVGSSLGITADLSTSSKLLLCIAMFVGRVGLLSLLMGLATQQHEENKRILPYDNIIIN